MTYSLDLREKALQYIANGGTRKEASRIFGVTIRTLANWLRRKKQNTLTPKARRQSPSKIDSDRLKEYVQQNPDAYLREIAEAFGVTLQGIFYACKRLGISLKKRSPSSRKEVKKNERNSRKN